MVSVVAYNISLKYIKGFRTLTLSALTLGQAHNRGGGTFGAFAPSPKNVQRIKMKLYILFIFKSVI